MAPGVPEKVAPHVQSKAAVRKAQKQRPHKPTVEGERRIQQSPEQVSSERRRGRAARWGSGTPAAMVLIAPEMIAAAGRVSCSILITVRIVLVLGDPSNDSWRWLHVQKRRDVTTLEGARSKHKEAQR